MIEIDTLVKRYKLSEAEQKTLDYLVSIIVNENSSDATKEDAASKIKKLLYQQAKER